MGNQSGRSAELQYELELARLRSHEKHMVHIYSLRWGALGLAGITIVIGAVMIFWGLQGSFDWAFQAPNSIGAKLTNASPGIVFATVGMLIGILAVVQKPVNYSTGRNQRLHDGRGVSLGLDAPREDYSIDRSYGDISIGSSSHRRDDT
jgi:hypothetical protein